MMQLYSRIMDVAITTFRAELSTWIDHARHGEDVVITERGMPVARLMSVDSAPLLDRLHAEGVIGKPSTSARPSARAARRVKARGPVADLVSDQRR
jgi:prevent-host-death family protein